MLYIASLVYCAQSTGPDNAPDPYYLVLVWMHDLFALA